MMVNLVNPTPAHPLTPTNACMFQGFEWYVAPDGKHWRRLARDVPALEQIGITAMWIPPACKGGGPDDNGYGIYGTSPFPSFLLPSVVLLPAPSPPIIRFVPHFPLCKRC